MPLIDTTGDLFTLKKVGAAEASGEERISIDRVLSGEDEDSRKSDCIARWPKQNTGQTDLAINNLGKAYCFDACVTNGVGTKFKFIQNDFMSFIHVELKISDQCPLSTTGRNPGFKLNYKTCSTLEVRSLSGKSFNHLLSDQMPAYGDRNVGVLVQLSDDELVNSEGLFVDSCPVELLPLRSALRAGQVLAIVMKSTLGLEESFATVVECFTIDSTQQKWRYLHDELEPSFSSLSSRKPVDTKLKPCLPVEVCFFDFEHYYLSLGLAAEIERELTESKQTASWTSKAWIIQPDANDNNHFTAILELPRTFTSDFSRGDTATAWLEFGADSHHGKEWDIKVVHPLPGTTNQMMTTSLTRRPNLEMSGYLDERRVPTVTPNKALLGAKAQVQSILKNNFLLITVRPDSRHGIFHRVFEGLGKLFNSRTGDSPISTICDFLVGQKPVHLPRRSIYNTLSDPSLAAPEFMNLNSSQLEAIDLANRAPGGFVICHGGPGTGKTHFVVEALKPFLKDERSEHSILVTSPANHGVDALAIALHTKLRLLIADNPKLKHHYVVRMHSEKTEQAILMQQADQERSKRLEELQKEKKGKASEATVTQRNASNDTLYAMCRELNARRYAMVEDERVRHIELSVGQQALRFAGLLQGGPDVSTTDVCKIEFQKFRELYERYRKGEDFGPETKYDLEVEVARLIHYTIRHATIVCCTMAAAGDEVVCLPYFGAELIVVDEAARVSEYQWWPLLAFYPHAAGKILVGDPNQLKVFKKSESSRWNGEYLRAANFNPFAEQLAMSLQERLQTIGVESAFFTTQYRAAPEISRIYNDIVYQGRLLDDSSTLVQARPLAMQIQEHNLKYYQNKSSVVFYVVSGTKGLRGRKKSWYCERTAIGVMNILTKLLQDGFGTAQKRCSIAILTPYVAQYEMLRVDLDEMMREIPWAKDVVLNRLEMAQGLEYDIIILDPAITRTAGFLNLNRLNVFFSRAKCGLYVVGDSQRWSILKGDNGAHVRSFRSQLSKYRFLATETVSKYHEERTDENEGDEWDSD